jgi:TonB family protein
MAEDARILGFFSYSKPTEKFDNMRKFSDRFKNIAAVTVAGLLMICSANVMSQAEKPSAENAAAPADLAAAKAAQAVIVPAKLIQAGQLTYPKNMLQWGLVGKGLLDIVVDTKGRVKSVSVLESPHPAFESTIVRSALASTFSPSTTNGVPTQVTIRMPYSFQIDRPDTDGTTPFAFPRKPSEGVARELQYDTPPAIKIVAPVVYPRELLRSNTTGSATVAARLDKKGRIVAVQVLEATHPDFGEATKAMIDAWEFKPAMKDNVAIENVFKIHQKFTRREFDTGFNGRTYTLLDELNSRNSEVVEMDKLDAKPKLLYQPAPFDPVILGESKAEDVVIEFFIDPDGGVQLPRIVSAVTPSRGWAAATAMKRWIFEVPKVGGKPVYVRRELALGFK